MDSVDHESLRKFLTRAGVKVADPALRIGRALTFASPPARTVVVHLGNATDHIAGIISIVLSIDATWFLIPRYGAAAQLGLVEGTSEVAAVTVAPSERGLLGRYLCERPMDLGATSTDIYVVGASGNILVTWDHHTADEGLTVGLRRVEDSNRLLVSLNDLGAE